MTAENWSAAWRESKYIACAEIFSRINMVFSSKDGEKVVVYTVINMTK